MLFPEIDYKLAWDSLVAELKKLHELSGDIEEEPAHTIYHNIVHNIIPDVLSRQINVYGEPDNTSYHNIVNNIIPDMRQTKI